ncbi:RlmE family RNA methyltransferase [Marinimicrococcus flavescens]|uniref:Ribosomal RNA large subunit methyltransferase E n=1 Tax=Marinimicrococcus flavescens TaxID=3031815 RepID=A0AAP3V124_9PROT|nr:RlmE family RNA methyltransferase [Marinimicrococcus flavescens]
MSGGSTGGSGSGTRRLKERVRTARKRSNASTRWLERQLNDPYVHEARRQGYRARSIFKLEELDKRFSLLRRHARIVDLGAAPGSWTQYAAQRGCRVVGVDLLPVQPVAGAEIIEGDFLDPAIQDRLVEMLGGPADMVLSDIAASATGTRAVDRLKAEGVAEAVLAFAERVLRPGGSCLIKLLKGAEAPIMPSARRLFSTCRLLKPDATRSDSSEIFLLATGRRAPEGGAAQEGEGGS